MDLTYSTGFGVVWGIGTEVISTGQGMLLPLDEELVAGRQNEAHYDKGSPGVSGHGQVIGETFFRKETYLRVRLVPGGGTLTAAYQANAWFLEPGTEIFLVDTTDPQIAGSWVLLELGKARRHDSKGYWDMTLRRHGDNFVRNSNQRLSATVTS
jgi:hypothetical protein